MVPNPRERMVQVLTRRDLLSAAGALAAGVLTRGSGFAQSASAAGAASPDPMSFVNTEFRAALGPIAKMMETVQSLNASSLISLRQGMNMPANAPAPNPPVTEKTIPGPTGGARGSRLCRRKFDRRVETGGTAYAWWRLRHRLRLRCAPRHPELVNGA